jgi:serine/threonine protein kinase
MEQDTAAERRYESRAMIGRRLGRFTITAPLGEGGMATVWTATDELLRRTVALKVLREALASQASSRRRFLHEARAASLLDHPGVATVYDFGEADGLVFIAFALIEGETLSACAAREPVPAREAARVVGEAAAAIAHAHARGVIHRDVTGRNVMIARDGRAVVLDFGLALAAGQSRLTSAETALGTVTYMAPEVLAGQPADARSDVYGLGVVLYEALTGAFPFVDQRPEALFFRVQNEEPRPPRELRAGIPPELERVVLKALARDPDARYQDAATLAAELRAIAGTQI